MNLPKMKMAMWSWMKRRQRPRLSDWEVNEKLYRIKLEADYLDKAGIRRSTPPLW